MMMGLRVRVIHDFRRIDDQLADQLLLEEELERVVNSRLGGFGVARIDEREDLIGGKMFPAREQRFSDYALEVSPKSFYARKLDSV